MSYQNATKVLPAHLLQEIQEYIEGSLIYIPKKGKRAGWGCKSGTRDLLQERNAKIIRQFKQGTSIKQLADAFYLSPDSVKKIIYRQKQFE